MPFHQVGHTSGRLNSVQTAPTGASNVQRVVRWYCVTCWGIRGLLYPAKTKVPRDFAYSHR
ncbi:MAG: hypothetical protein JWO52_6402 [Gammaproteobacteria bacterium]|jgi:hypothetical protein|nr:hypothetical protein [Gammaproteobacteria bacterium]